MVTGGYRAMTGEVPVKKRAYLSLISRRKRVVIGLTGGFRVIKEFCRSPPILREGVYRFLDLPLVGLV